MRITPKAKAQQLILECREYVQTWDYYCDTTRDEEDIVSDAKKIAFYMVVEIEFALLTTTGHLNLNTVEDFEVSQDFEFWRNVKKELV